MKFKFNRAMREQFKKGMAMTLAVSMFFEIIAPTYSWALTGGPSQPEVQGFTPIGTSDMVDLFTGDFSYNIPLLDIDGYPINISYSGGITMDQEASWVGLGWNLNPGVVNRAMRGIPDDFSGDEVEKEFKTKPNVTYGVKGDMGFELFGFDENDVNQLSPIIANDNVDMNVNFSVGLNYNNYTGIGIERSINSSISAGKKSDNPLNASLGLNSSSSNGLSVQPSIGFNVALKNKDQYESKSLTGKLGASFNSRMGLSNLTFGVSYSNQMKGLDRKDNVVSANAGFGLGNASFDMGMPTYTPSSDLPSNSFNATASFKLGPSIFGGDATGNVSGYVSVQKLRENSRKNPAYGYMNSNGAVNNKDALLDFNRENDGSFTPTTPALAVSNFTYDLFSVSGQGVGGSYRAYRTDVGHIFDPYNETTSNSGSLGLEFGTGQLFKGGIDVNVTHVTSTSGNWTVNNEAGQKLQHKGTAYNSLKESFYLKEANEKNVQTDQSFYSQMGGADPVRFNLVEESKYNTYADDKFVNQHGGNIAITTNEKNGREKRNQVIAMISHQELKAGAGTSSLHPDAYDNGNGHHIGEVTSLGADGRRYVYGIAAYNTYQEEVSFAIGANINGNDGTIGDCISGLVSYDPNVDNSLSNDRGIDNYYSATKMPAYAHSYLLTSVLSPDYVDADNIKGPSKGDLGTWIKFNYDKVANYGWRTPVEQNKANYNEGLKSDPTDDKANYVYGKKELWYVTSIETKNYIAVFELEDRVDGHGVTDRNGGTSNSNPAMKLLRKITLYSKTANGVNPVPIKEVHFEYDYSLCPHNPNNLDYLAGETDPTKTGKLTLKRVYFTYQGSNKAKFSPYKFEYNSLNPSYNIKAYDRWGCYKPNPGVDCDALSGTQPPTAEFPYVEQNQSSADSYTSAWMLTDIYLPSGGKIHVDYESDDYAYVQHKKASQMFKIVGVGDDLNSTTMSVPGNTAPLSDLNNKNRRIFFPLVPGYNSLSDLDKYLGGQTYLYFRCLVEFAPATGNFNGRHDYVSGYAEILDKGIDATGNYGWIELKPVSLSDGNNDKFNPITKAAIQYGRMHLSRYIWNQPNVAEGEGFGADVLNAIINSSFAENISDAINGPNRSIWEDGKGRKIVLNKSWIRLTNPNKKLGGGHRVKKISMSDEWDVMTNNAMAKYDYGQEYEYQNEDGTSSGVASYEPQIGGDENSFKQPVFFSNDDPDKKMDNLLTPREDFYQEEPLGESFFPSPSVGYSRVIVKNIARQDVSRTATGKVVHEFYTAKDFPTIAKRTDVESIRNKNNPFSVQALFNINSKDHMTASQGFVVELNDMHGKPKKQMVYQEDQTDPITSVEYLYESEPLNLDGANNFKLKNTAKIIYPNGQTGDAEIGVFFDMIADMRQNYTKMRSGGINLNVDGFLAAILPVVVPIPYPSYSSEETQFRSASTTKVINRFGILKETIARDLGSEVSTRNLAYDSETGDVLLTQTTTDFNDEIYSLTYPSHWYYDGMGQAYKNLQYKRTEVTFNANGMTNVANAHLYFSEGDEVFITEKATNAFNSLWLDNYSSAMYGWVTDVNSTGIKVMKKDGSLLTGGPYALKVIRSGRRNMQSVPIASITTLKNPLDQLGANLFENVLQSSAMEFDQEWNTFCDCFEDPQAANFTTNPYVLGTKGNWRMKRSWLHLSPRTQSNYDNNTNIRKDGMFTSYTPFYKLQASKWVMDALNWTFTSEVTEFSPFGQELENRDALGRYSAATFGYNQSLATAVGANTQYRELGFDNFEDYEYGDCFDDHFKFRDHLSINSNHSHTGKRSVKVSATQPASFKQNFENCEAPKCELSFNLIQEFSPTSRLYRIASGTAPYSIDYDVVSGSTTPSVASDGVSITLTGSGTINITIVDANGCQVIKTIKI